MATLHTLPAPFTHSPHPPVLLTQGAEGLVYRTSFLTEPSRSTDGGDDDCSISQCALKYRPKKPYRHPILDKRLSRQRILAEARVLVKCRRAGVQCPGVVACDWEAGWLAMEWIDGLTIRTVLDRTLPGYEAAVAAAAQNKSDQNSEAEKEEKEHELWDLMRRLGKAIGRMHEIGVVHGDLTTSNLMLRPPRSKRGASSENEASSAPVANATEGREEEAATRESTSVAGTIVLIDFGLAQQTIQDEDRAVDLYVLERAFSATHPAAEELFKEVLKSYGESFRGAKVALKRLEDVRMRGRKKSMLG